MHNAEFTIIIHIKACMQNCINAELVCGRRESLGTRLRADHLRRGVLLTLSDSWRGVRDSGVRGTVVATYTEKWTVCNTVTHICTHVHV